MFFFISFYLILCEYAFKQKCISYLLVLITYKTCRHTVGMHFSPFGPLPDYLNLSAYLDKGGIWCVVFFFFISLFNAVTNSSR